MDGPADAKSGDIDRRDLNEILDVIPPNPRRPYEMRAVLEMLVDHGSLFEIQPAFGSAVVTALAQIGGQSVAIVANDPSALAGTIDTDAADKATHFPRRHRRIPSPDGLSRRQSGCHGREPLQNVPVHCDHVARMFVAQHRLTAPKFHVTLRKAFGFGSTIMAMNPFDGADAHPRLPCRDARSIASSERGEIVKLDDQGKGHAPPLPN